jgi:hypothetical protein
MDIGEVTTNTQIDEWNHIISLRAAFSHTYTMTPADKAHELRILKREYYQKYKVLFNPDVRPILNTSLSTV